MDRFIARPILASTRAALIVVLALGLAPAGAGCGNCDGAIRELRVRSPDVCGPEACSTTNGVTHAGFNMSVRVVGDGPNDESEALLADSGIGPETFFLLDANDEQVAVRITGDAGGHTCRKGVGFNLEPEQSPTFDEAYTLVLVLEDLDWPLVGGAATQVWEGRTAFVREIHITSPDEG